MQLNAHNKIYYHSRNWLQFLRRIKSIVFGIKDQEQRKFSQIKRPCYEWYLIVFERAGQVNTVNINH